jgi:prevent-host-death family protein
MSVIVNIHEAKSQLSRLIAAVERGEEVTIANKGVPKVKLVRAEPVGRKRVPGKFAQPGVTIPADFDAPLTGWWDQ